MKKVNPVTLFFSGIIAAVTFLIIEFIIESAADLLFGLSESAYYKRFDIVPAESAFQLINVLIFIVEMCLIMYVYTLIRPRFKTNVRAALATSGLVLGFALLIFANFVNLGIITSGMATLSFIFNLIELPPAVVLGAIYYGE